TLCSPRRTPFRNSRSRPAISARNSAARGARWSTPPSSQGRTGFMATSGSLFETTSSTPPTFLKTRHPRIFRKENSGEISLADPFYTGASLAGISDFTTPAQEALLNMLPANRLDPNAIKLLSLYPSPTGPGIVGNFTADRVNKHDINHYDVRIDHNFSTADQMFGRVSFSHDNNFKPAPFVGFADGGSFNTGQYVDVNFNSVLSETHSFSSA